MRRDELIFQLLKNTTEKVSLRGIAADVTCFDALLLDDRGDGILDLLSHTV